MTRLKELILSNNNKLAVFINSNIVDLRVVVFKKMNWIYRFCKNKVVLEMA